MSSYLRRLVAMGPAGTIYPGPGCAWDYRYNSNQFAFADTRTAHVRFWADWPTLQPSPNYMPDDPNNPNYGIWQQFIAQVAQAHADGLYPMVTAYRFPQWATGTDQQYPRGSVAEIEYQPQDRVSEATWNRYVNSNPRDYTIMNGRKDIWFMAPTDVSTTSPWGKWIDCLIRNLTGIAFDFEFVNEPNHQMWPQQKASTTSNLFDSGSDSIACVLPYMWTTADAINAGYGRPLWLYGPALSDDRGSSRLHQAYDVVAKDVLDGLKNVNFLGNGRCMWSHHNYHDIEYDCGSGSWTGETVSGAANLRQILTDKGWAGWRSDGSPGIMMTEGGALLSTIGKISAYAGKDVQSLQAQLIQRAWNRMNNGGEGAGIGMMAQYLFWTEPVSSDCGLLNPLGSSSPGRPAYNTWHNLPVYSP